MLVAHQSDHITHAVIGGKKTINFGISDDPAFFQILSSALYKNPMLAMVRETICNAWDAHIESGRTDQHVIITLDDDYLIIRDFGWGIPDHMIGQIYGVYGASTKKNDGRQTGGFGLGCKSPFAYTDHFEVTSCNNGTKTIYNMSKSSAQVQGKPSIIPIASFPTTETGITVKIPLDPGKDNDKLHQMVKEVVFNGDIRATLNGESLEILGLDNAEAGMVLINNDAWGYNDHNHLNKAHVYVRYGNVIYPVECADEYKTLWNKVTNLLHTYYNCRLVLLAPPDSISITPSRESLTLSDITVGTVTTLLTKFLAMFFRNQEMIHRYRQMVVEYVDAAAKKEAPVSEKLPIGGWFLPGVPITSENKVLGTTEEFAMLEIFMRFSGRKKDIKPKDWLKYISRYLHHMGVNGEFDRGLWQTWYQVAVRIRKNLRNPQYSRNWGDTHDMRAATMWWRKRVLAPLVLKLQDTLPGFNRRDLYYNSFHMNHEGYKKREPLSPRSVLIDNHTQNLVHLLKPTIIVTFNATQLARRVPYIMPGNEFQGTLKKDCYFAYEISRRKGEAERVIEVLQTLGDVEIIDMTKRLPHEQRAFDERKAEIAKARADAAAGKRAHAPLIKKARPGLVRFDYILNKNTKQIDTKILAQSTDPIRITDPEFVVLVSTGKEKRHHTRDMDAKVSYAAAMLYGSKGAVTNKQDAYERYQKEKKAVDLNDYIVDRILVDVQTLPTLMDYHAAARSKMDTYIEKKVGWNRRTYTEVIDLLIENPELQYLIPSMQRLSEEDSYRWTLWQMMNQYTPYHRRKEVEAVREKIDKIPLKKEITEFLDKFLENPFLGLIDVEQTGRLLREHRKDPNAVAKIVSFITPILS